MKKINKGAWDVFVRITFIALGPAHCTNSILCVLILTNLITNKSRKQPANPKVTMLSSFMMSLAVQ